MYAIEDHGDIKVNLDLPKNVQVLADEVELARVISNLLENARRYGTGEVRVTVAREARHVLLRVCDRGPGVPASERERIFEPFYRMPGASEREGGVGLGLALVRSIAQRHQGSAHCEDNPGGGACFVLDLPSEQM